MASIPWLLLRSPFRSLIFSYSFSAEVLLIILRKLLLPHHPTYRSVRTLFQRAYLSCASIYYPEIVHGLPISAPAERAQKVGSEKWTGYVIPGCRKLEDFARKPCVGISERMTVGMRTVVLYAHGGGYAQGEARMYMRYMERWIGLAQKMELDLVFVSVEYPLTKDRAHPAQLNAFLAAYQHLLDQNIPSANIVFMGDSAGAGLCILAAIKLLTLNLPQPAGSVLVSPWMDFSLRAYIGGNALSETDYVISANHLVPSLIASFLRDTQISGADPEVNPLFRRPEELTGLNRQLVLVGAAEIALQEGKDWATLCNKAGIEHELVVEKAQLHIYAMGSRLVDPRVRQKTDNLILSWIVDSVRGEK